MADHVHCIDRVDTGRVGEPLSFEPFLPAEVQVVERVVLSSELVNCEGAAPLCPSRPATPNGVLPAAYRDGALVNVTPVDVQSRRVGVGFDVGQDRVRVALSLDDARALVEVLRAYLAMANASHAPSSSGIPSRDVLPQEG